MTESPAWTAGAGRDAWRRLRDWRPPFLPLRDWRGEAAAILLLIPVLLHMALWNGFPLLFFDSGAYMYQGFSLVPAPDRSPVYSLFLRYAGGQSDLWHVAWLQCLMTSVAMVEFARAVRPHTGLWTMLGIGVLLSLCTSLAWVAGQIQPDFLTPILVLTLYPLAFHAKRVGWARALPIVALGGFAAAGHPSHIGLCAGLVLVLAITRLLAITFRRRLPRPNLMLPFLCCVFGFALVLQAQHVLTHRYEFGRSGPVFLAARLLADGSALRTLDEICPTRHLQLCPYRGEIARDGSAFSWVSTSLRADAFLWSGTGPFNKIGGFKGPMDEYAFLVRETLRRHPLDSVGGMALHALAQFVLVRTGDGFLPVQRAVYTSILYLVPDQMSAFLTARQQHDALHTVAFNVVHLPVALLSLWWLLWVLRRNLSLRGHRVGVSAFLLFALIGNATICGMVSGAHDRYQSRLLWIVPFALLLTERQTLRNLGAIANCRRLRDTVSVIVG